jgi:hypothetical protein
LKLKSISAILISTGLSFLYSYLLSNFSQKETSVWWQSLVFFIVLSTGLNLLYNIKTDKKTYSGILLSSGIIKFLFSLVFLIAYLFTLKGGFFTFFLHFIGHYVLFTVFEIRYLLQLIKTHQNEN